MRKILFSIVVSGSLVNPAWAAESNEPQSERSSDATITVVASGLPSDDAGDGYAVAVVDDADLRALQGPDLTRALRRLPGVTLTRNSGIGGFTGVRVRGAGAEQLLVLIDGVKVNDPSSPGGGFDFGSVTGDAVGRIELLRGSHSVIWGSDALAGVMNLQTRSVDGFAGSAEYGGAKQFSGHAVVGTVGDVFDAHLSGGYVRSRGISAAALGTERDGFEQANLAGRLEWRLDEATTIQASGRFAQGTLELDGFPPPTYFAFADTNEYQESRERSGRVALVRDSGAIRISAALSRSVNERDLVDEDAGPAPYYETRGLLTRAELFGRLTPSDRVRIDFGADHEWSRFAADSAFSNDRGNARTASGHAMLTYDFGGASLGAGARYDHHNRFGGAWSPGANAALRLGANALVRAAYGEGFKAPTLFQLLSDFGNAGLRPERSRSYDLGLEYGRGERFMAALSLFRRDSRDLIDFVSCFGKTGGICAGRPNGTYDNVGRARAEGFELELGANPTPGLSLGAAYSYVRARDGGTGRDLARRPRHALTVRGDWNAPLGLLLGADVRLVGDSFDDAGNFTRIDGRALFDLRGSVPLFAMGTDGGRPVELYGRVENVFDTRATEVAGYTPQGRAAYVGVRFAM